MPKAWGSVTVQPPAQHRADVDVRYPDERPAPAEPEMAQARPARSARRVVSAAAAAVLSSVPTQVALRKALAALRQVPWPRAAARPSALRPAESRGGPPGTRCVAARSAAAAWTGGYRPRAAARHDAPDRLAPGPRGGPGARLKVQMVLRAARPVAAAGPPVAPGPTVSPQRGACVAEPPPVERDAPAARHGAPVPQAGRDVAARARRRRHEALVPRPSALRAALARDAAAPWISPPACLRRRQPARLESTLWRLASHQREPRS